uniref:Peptidase A1 domain-containing protein n=1 Tax=Strombidium inclinatum TaxID=197538 RepID=A0A7S3IR17_9SPIT|mmetsp:Transcript_34959/g.53664  ORF Transcript_34959/g.53664 Transcript_34959/m.53664 type:complete len:387 (+) Transcript_34959:185-1345(+)
MNGSTARQGTSLNIFGAKALVGKVNLGRNAYNKPLPAVDVYMQTAYDQTFFFGQTATKKCVGCTSSTKQGYRIDQSVMQMHDYYDDHSPKEFQYGNTTLIGEHQADMVCLKSDGQNCARPMHFFMATKAKTGDPVTKVDGAGVAGLAYKHRNSQNYLFTQQLKNSGAIKKSVFSITFRRDEPAKSKILFGGYNLGKYALPNRSIRWHSVVQGQSTWTLNMDQHGLETKYAYKWSSPSLGTYAQIDSSIEGIHVRESSKPTVERYIKETIGYDFNLYQIDYYASCTDYQWSFYPDLIISLNGHRYWVSKDAYWKRENNKCTLKLFTKKGYDKWVLGQAWLETQYTIFDYDNDRVGFVTSKNARPLGQHSAGYSVMYKQNNTASVEDI